MQQNVPFVILERDESPTTRGQGWAITIHWALPYIQEILPPEVISRIQGRQVDPEVAANDTGNFLFLNLEDCSIKFKIPPNKRLRVKREEVRLALLEGIEDCVLWRKRAVEVYTPTTETPAVQVKCQDGSMYQGRIAIGVEGNNSMVRRILRPDAYKTTQLPVRCVGVAVSLTPEQAKPLRDLDPLLFQGCHPETGNYLWYSTLETPASAGADKKGEPKYLAQINISWRVKGPEDEVALSDSARLEEMKRRAQCFAPTLKRLVDEIPDDTPVLEVKLCDWECLDWDNVGGSITLAGDAAHAMTMCRWFFVQHGGMIQLMLAQIVEKQPTTASLMLSTSLRRSSRYIMASHRNK
jgi:2-polyprenyl-6-methoxyphenol hydroxylase-like FAD-dependent oxidoreductase